MTKVCVPRRRAAHPAVVLGVSALLVAVLPGMAQSQSVGGHLLDDLNEAPIPGADVFLLSGAEGERVVEAVLTDSTGWFLLDSRNQGRFRLRAQRLGYQPVTSPPFDLTGSDTLAVELRMSVQAILLAPLTVVSERMPLVNSIRLETGGFVERRSTYGREGMGAAHFLVRSDWENRSPSRLADIVRELPGMRMMGGSTIRMRSVTSFGQPWGCVPHYYLNGSYFPLSAGESIQEYVSPIEISAIEVYPGLSRPAQFMDMSESTCGAIVIWTGVGG